MEWELETVLSWTVVYSIIAAPALIMLIRFILGECFMSELHCPAVQPEHLRSPAQRIGRACVVIVLAGFTWQYYVFYYRYRKSVSAVSCSVGTAIYSCIFSECVAWSDVAAALLTCSAEEVLYGASFVACLSSYIACVCSSPHGGAVEIECCGASRSQLSFCRKCGATVFGMDHHCYVIANCVGSRNRVLFLIALSTCAANMGVLLWYCWSWASHEARGSPSIVVGRFLALLVFSLSLSLFVFHLALIWCGFTTLTLLRRAAAETRSPLGYLVNAMWQRARASWA